MPGWIPPPGGTGGLAGLWYGWTSGLSQIGIKLPSFLNKGMDAFTGNLTDFSNIIFYGVIGIAGLIVLIIVFALFK